VTPRVHLSAPAASAVRMCGRISIGNVRSIGGMSHRCYQQEPRAMPGLHIKWGAIELNDRRLGRRAAYVRSLNVSLDSQTQTPVCQCSRS
jgi:hypothetical protein